MTQRKILNLAFLKALDLWEDRIKIAKNMPGNEFALAAAEMAMEDVEYIGRLLYEEEHKEA